jgi:hypothetical protein
MQGLPGIGEIWLDLHACTVAEAHVRIEAEVSQREEPCRSAACDVALSQCGGE